MGLNNIALPSSLIKDFYQYHLLENPAAAPVAAPVTAGSSTKKGIQYLGKNQKGICLLVNYPNDVYLPDEQLNFLTTILQACRLHLGDVAIVNHHRTKIGLDELREQLDCRHLLVFGLEPAAIGLEAMPLFSAQNVQDCSVVLSTAAEQLNNNTPESKSLKSKLWLCLKQLFNV